MKLVIQNPEHFEPGYELTVHYMIGDADGDKDFSICFDNPMKIFLNSLKFLISLMVILLKVIGDLHLSQNRFKLQ